MILHARNSGDLIKEINRAREHAYTYLYVYYAKSTGYRLGTSKLGAFSDDHVRRTVDHDRIKINIINTEKRFTIKIKVNISVSNIVYDTNIMFSM